MIKSFAVIVLWSFIGVLLGSNLFGSDAFHVGLYFCIAAATSFIVQAIYDTKQKSSDQN